MRESRDEDKLPPQAGISHVGRRLHLHMLLEHLPVDRRGYGGPRDVAERAPATGSAARPHERWAFPLAFLLVNLFLGVIFLGARAAPVALS
jgi:hypothetical protein